MFESDALGFQSDAVLGRLKPCVVGSKNIRFRQTTVRVESALVQFQPATVGILS